MAMTTLSRRQFGQGALALAGGLPLIGRAAAPPLRPVFIDTDTASDDAVALMLAFAEPGIDIVGIATVAGNVPLDSATQTALYVRELCRSKAPIHVGADRPLMRDLQTAQNVHGKDGMGDIGLPIGDRKPDSMDAVGALIEAARRYPGTLELVTLGPLTNIAVALRRAPEIAKQIKSCTVMGGVADYVGNMTPVSEFNIWVDPEAAEITLRSGLAIEMVGWDISRKYAVIDDNDAASLRAIGTERARIAIDCQKVLRVFNETESGLKGFDLPDPIAMAVALRPAIGTKRRADHASVIGGEGPTRGMVMFDETPINPKGAKISVVEQASRQDFMTMMRQALNH
jgi:purine nucleosidase